MNFKIIAFPHSLGLYKTEIWYCMLGKCTSCLQYKSTYVMHADWSMISNVLDVAISMCNIKV